MKRPYWINIWFEDPFDRKFLGGVGLPYSAHECARGLYRFDIEAIRQIAIRTIKAARRPVLRIKFI